MPKVDHIDLGGLKRRLSKKILPHHSQALLISSCCYDEAMKEYWPAVGGKLGELVVSFAGFYVPDPHAPQDEGPQEILDVLIKGIPNAKDVPIRYSDYFTDPIESCGLSRHNEIMRFLDLVVDHVERPEDVAIRIMKDPDGDRGVKIFLNEVANIGHNGLAQAALKHSGQRFLAIASGLLWQAVINQACIASGRPINIVAYPGNIAVIDFKNVPICARMHDLAPLPQLAG